MNLQENIRRILKEEMDEWEWARDIKPTYSVEDIKNLLNKPFKLYNTETGELDSDIGEVMDGVYWLEKNGYSPKEYNVCWNRLSHGKDCVSYDATNLIDNFNGVGYWTWKFVD